MVFRILVDLSHYESIQTIPDKFFPSQDYLFFFNSAGEKLGNFESLQQYDLIILGNPQPKFRGEQLFTPPELRTIKAYVKSGGKILITTSNRGDFNHSNSLGSLRVLHKITGIVQYAYALNYMTDPEQYIDQKSNLLIRDFPHHPIFEDFTPDDYLVFGKSTFMTIHPEISLSVLLTTPKLTWSHNYATKQNDKLGSQPLFVYNRYFKGLAVVLSSSSFLTTDPANGITAGSNGKFVNHLFSWIFNQ